jgi:hypothetical protein
MFADVARRDFTRAIISASPPGSNFDCSKSQTYSRVRDVQDNDGRPIKLYVLKADGKTGGYCGPAVTPDHDGACPGKIQLRSGEGIVAMKQPID